MKTQLEWLIPGQLLYAARSGPESLVELETFTGKVIRLLEQEGQDSVHLIWNMAGLNVEGVDQREAMIWLNKIMKYPKLKWFVVVDQDMPSFRRWIAAIVLRLTGVHWQVVDSQEDALAFLLQKDATLSRPGENLK